MNQKIKAIAIALMFILTSFFVIIGASENGSALSVNAESGSIASDFYVNGNVTYSTDFANSPTHSAKFTCTNGATSYLLKNVSLTFPFTTSVSMFVANNTFNGLDGYPRWQGLMYLTYSNAAYSFYNMGVSWESIYANNTVAIKSTDIDGNMIDRIWVTKGYWHDVTVVAQAHDTFELYVDGVQVSSGLVKDDSSNPITGIWYGKVTTTTLAGAFYYDDFYVSSSSVTVVNENFESVSGSGWLFGTNYLATSPMTDIGHSPVHHSGISAAGFYMFGSQQDAAFIGIDNLNITYPFTLSMWVYVYNDLNHVPVDSFIKLSTSNEPLLDSDLNNFVITSNGQGYVDGDWGMMLMSQNQTNYRGTEVVDTWLPYYPHSDLYDYIVPLDRTNVIENVTNYEWHQLEMNVVNYNNMSMSIDGGTTHYMTGTNGTNDSIKSMWFGKMSYGSINGSGADGTLYYDDIVINGITVGAPTFYTPDVTAQNHTLFSNRIMVSQPSYVTAVHLPNGLSMSNNNSVSSDFQHWINGTLYDNQMCYVELNAISASNGLNTTLKYYISVSDDGNGIYEVYEDMSTDLDVNWTLDNLNGANVQSSNYSVYPVDQSLLSYSSGGTGGGSLDQIISTTKESIGVLAVHQTSFWFRAETLANGARHAFYINRDTSIASNDIGSSLSIKNYSGTIQLQSYYHVGATHYYQNVTTITLNQWHCVFVSDTSYTSHMIWVDGIRYGTTWTGSAVHSYPYAQQIFIGIYATNTRVYTDNFVEGYNLQNPLAEIIRYNTTIVGSASPNPVVYSITTNITGSLRYSSNTTKIANQDLSFVGYKPNYDVLVSTTVTTNALGNYYYDDIMSDILNGPKTYGVYHILIWFDQTGIWNASNVLNITLNVTKMPTTVTGSLTDSGLYWWQNTTANGVLIHTSNGTRINNVTLQFLSHSANQTYQLSTTINTTGTGTWNYTDLMYYLRASGWGNINGTYTVHVWYLGTGNYADSNILTLTFAVNPTATPPYIPSGNGYLVLLLMIGAALIFVGVAMKWMKGWELK